MKRLVCTFLLVIFLKLCFSQYTVTKVVGNVKNKASGEPLKFGTKFSDPKMLVFSSENDMVRAIVTGKGVMVINANPQPEKNQSIATEILKYTFHVKSREGNLSGRGGSIELIPEALETDALYNTKDLFEKENKYLFDKIVFQVSNGDKFFLQIEYPGATPVIHPLKTISDTLIIYASDFETPEPDTSGKAKYTLGFYSKEKNSSESLHEIKPCLDSSGKMKTIIKAMITESKEDDKAILQQLCYREVYESLGKPPTILFKEMFDKLILSYAKK